MNDWHVEPFQQAPAGQVLQRGLELLDGLAADGRPVLRFYRATTPAIVLGRGQGGLLTDAPTAAVQVLTRHSGGGAVQLGPDVLCADVVVPTGHPLLYGALGAVFVRVGTAWAEALEELGVDDLQVYRGPATARRRGSPRERLLAAVCYATLGRGEVLAGGRKLLGLAQRRRRQGALVQCGLLRRWRPGYLLAALGATPADGEILRRAVGLHDLRGTPPADEHIIAAVTARLTR